MSKIRIDELGKKINSYKSVIAMYVKYCIEDFKNMELKEIISHIVDTSIDKPIISGIHNEIILQGMTRRDVLAILEHPTKKNHFINVNIELQASEYLPYSINNRAIFYDSSMIVTQKETTFFNSDYDNIDAVYTIFVILKPKKNIEGNMQIITRQSQNLLVTKDKTEILSQETIPISNITILRMKDDISHPLFKMINDLFLEISDEETYRKNLANYGILDLSKKEVKEMCNLHEAYILQGIEKGIEQGIAQGSEKEKVNSISTMMQKLHKSFDEIYEMFGYDVAKKDHYRKQIEELKS